MIEPQGNIDFFISYRGARADWALWVNWVVRSAAYSTVLMDEFQVGTTWTDNMRIAARDCQRLIPIYSEDYWQSGACVAEFDAYWQQHLKNISARFILPLEVQDCEVPDLHKPLLRKSLHSLSRDEALAAIRKMLAGISSVSPGSTYSELEPPFPGVAVGPVPGAVALTWPAWCPTFVPDMANRHAEFTFFANMLCGGVPQRATLIAASTDHGKTKLVTEFHRYGCEVLGSHACSFVDFKSRGTIPDLWDTLILDLGNRIPGLSCRNPAKLREGLRRASEPVLIVIDTFESATEEAQNFVQSNLLSELGRTNALRLLVAGQPRVIPVPAKTAWQAHAKRFDLTHIPDPEPWVAWAARTYPSIPAKSVITIVACSGGAPGTVANHLATLGQFTKAQLEALGL